jgi:RNA polymerase sigma-70 factor (ECF subfamily)
MALEAERSRQDFPATRWSLVAAAGVDGRGDSGALAWLCERYWFPLFAYVRGKGHSPEDAEDLVQGFFAKLLEENLVERADGGRGRFRSFLLGCMNHFLLHDWRDAQRLKRGGGVARIALDSQDAEARLARDLPGQQSPETEYDRAWALTLLDRVAAQVQVECDADGNAGRFAVLECFLHGARAEMSLAAAAERLSVSLPAMKSIVHRLRKRFRERLMAEIRETVTSEDEVAAELQHLFASLSP